jgi:hypothetical protein
MAIRARNVDPLSPFRYIYSMHGPFSGTATLTGAMLDCYPVNQQRGATGQVGDKVVDILFSQGAAGVGGTSVTVTIKKNGTTICTTDAKLTLAGGANIAIDAKAEITPLPSGCIRPVLKSDSTIYLKKGDVLTADYTVSGSYSTAPQMRVTLVVDPFPI